MTRQTIHSLIMREAASTGQLKERAMKTRPMPEPIETAPKDGSTVNICIPAHTVRCFWCDEAKAWITTHEYTRNSVSNPTHWEPTEAQRKALAND